VTVKLVGLAAVPPGVVTWIFPVLAPVGTVAVIVVLELTEKVVAFTPPKVTLVAPVKLFQVICTTVPTAPLVGLKLAIVGVTRKILLLVRAPPGVVTVTVPVVAATGTTAVR